MGSCPEGERALCRYRSLQPLGRRWPCAFVCLRGRSVPGRGAERRRHFAFDEGLDHTKTGDAATQSRSRRASRRRAQFPASPQTSQERTSGRRTFPDAVSSWQPLRWPPHAGSWRRPPLTRKEPMPPSSFGPRPSAGCIRSAGWEKAWPAVADRAVPEVRPGLEAPGGLVAHARPLVVRPQRYAPAAGNVPKTIQYMTGRDEVAQTATRFDAQRNATGETIHVFSHDGNDYRRRLGGQLRGKQRRGWHRGYCG